MLTLILGPSGSGKIGAPAEELRQRARSRQRSILIVPGSLHLRPKVRFTTHWDDFSAYVESYSFTSLAETLLRRWRCGGARW